MHLGHAGFLRGIPAAVVASSGLHVGMAGELLDGGEINAGVEGIADE